MPGKDIPEKCRLCAKLSATQAQEINGCWDSSVCPSRRSHARHRARRNTARKFKRWKEQGRTVLVLTDAQATEQELAAATETGIAQIVFETQLPDLTYYAILQVYRQSQDAPLHAVGGEIWRGTQKQADITPVHCANLTPRQVEIYLERLLKKLQEVYGIRKFASKEELHPLCCPLAECKEKN